MSNKLLVVIGGGAAGFFCAVNAARMGPGLRVILLEKTGKLLSKVKVSGGGRCNVTHACFDIAEMIRNYPRGGNFLKRAFHHFFTGDTIEWFAERGVSLKTESDGRMFPQSNASQTIIDCLLREADTYKVEINTLSEVKEITRTDNRFSVLLSNGRLLQPDFLCIATGGYSKPSQFDWIAALGHNIVAPVPSLFTFNMPGNPITEMAGVSVPNARVSVPGTKLSEEGPVLITHWGLSGPAILRLSAWGARYFAECNYRFTISVSWLNEDDVSLREMFADFRTHAGAQAVAAKNSVELPQRLWQYLVQQSGVTDTRWGDLKSRQQQGLVDHLLHHKMEVSGKTTFKEEFVTAGGVELASIEAATMQSKRVPGLFFAGEVMDADGVTGGFNFQQAWTSGWIAASAITSLCDRA